MRDHFPFWSKALGLLVAGFLLAGCETVGETIATKINPQPIVPGKAVILNITKGGAVRREDYDLAAPLLRDELAERLLAEKIFAFVVYEVEKSDYEMDLSIFETRRSGGGKRVFLGFAAPRNFIRMSVKLRERVSNEEIQSYEVTGLGARNPWSPQGYGIDDPVRAAIEEIVQSLQGSGGAAPEAVPASDDQTDN